MAYRTLACDIGGWTQVERDGDGPVLIRRGEKILHQFDTEEEALAFFNQEYDWDYRSEEEMRARGLGPWMDRLRQALAPNFEAADRLLEADRRRAELKGENDL
jgi:hypothetical protein